MWIIGGPDWDGQWRVGLLYVGLKSADVAIERVAARVAAGGHHIPDVDVRRRFERSRKLLPTYFACIDRCLVFDNSGDVPNLLLDQWGPVHPEGVAGFPWDRDGGPFDGS